MPQLRRKDLFIDNILGVYPIIFRGAIILPLFLFSFFSSTAGMVRIFTFDRAVALDRATYSWP